MFIHFLFCLFFNAPTLVGVVFFHWSVPEILVMYWLENIIAGIFCSFKIKKIQEYHRQHQEGISKKQELKTRNSELKAVQKWETHYPAFTFGHGFFIMVIAGFYWGFNFVNLGTVIEAALVLLIDYTVAYKWGFLERKEEQTISLRQLISSSYVRIVILQLTIIFGVLAMVNSEANQYWFIVILIGLKILSEVFLIPRIKASPTSDILN